LRFVGHDNGDGEMIRLLAFIGFLWMSGLTIIVLFGTPYNMAIWERIVSICFGSATGLMAIGCLCVAITNKDIFNHIINKQL